MLDHIMLRVKDYDVSKRFYDELLPTLGYKRVMEFGEVGGYGDDIKPYFWIGAGPDTHPRTHIAFIAKDHAAVDAFHAQALKLGAKDDGAPGLRLEYHPSYYAAFVIDPDGHNIEAVCHKTADELRLGAPGPSSRKAAAKKATAKKTTAKKTTAKKKTAGAAKRAGARKKSAPRRKR
ncbi:VOC family protein [Hyalangium gracile]|uniref:VOC family protein n=1 Tax=Hyalangium gracile TaxID=394092 RepID=UPI001CCD91A5|nr:VOC family protein [Hyalangium gracile]